MNFTFIGLGYVGLVNSVVLASYGHNIIGYDIDKEKISLLKQGVSTLEEPGLQELLTKSIRNIRFTANTKDAIRHSNIFVVCVDTPQGKDGQPDLKNFYLALDDIKENVTQNSLVIVRSTVPVGTSALAKKYLEDGSSYRFEVVFMPEFLSQGKAVDDITTPTRLIIGVDDKPKETVARNIGLVFINNNKKIPILVTSLENAELVKYASNCFLAMKISYINSISRLCEKVGGDINEVALGMSYDPRIGSSFLKAGVGYGGSCFPKDTNGLYWLSSDNSEPLELVKATIEENEKQVEFFLNKIFGRIKTISNSKIAVFGVAFKGGTEDVRNSPAIPIVKALLDKGAYINVYDPLAEDNFHKLFSRYAHINYLDYPADALKDADAVVILTDSEEFKALTAEDYIELMRRPIIFDGRNLYELKDMVGTEYYSIGRKQLTKK